MIDFVVQLAEYVQVLESFREEHNLPDDFFAIPDHIAIKCADSMDYEREIQSWLPKATEAYYVHLNGRRLASARLLKPLVVDGFGSVEWLEIMEPRPERVGVDTVGIDHIEFKFGNFKAAEKVLDTKNLAFEQQENPGHQWLSIMAHDYEFKLTNKSLAEVVRTELASGLAISLKVGGRG